MQSRTAQKRQRTPCDEDTAFTAGGRHKRLQSAQPLSSVEHAMAMGSSRQLNGHVHGDNIYGNTSTTINNFHASPYGVPETAEVSKSPGIPSKTERDGLMERLRFPQLDARLTNLRKPQSHTCQWIVRRKGYEEWLDADDLKACDGFFWIKGNPGTGKSIAMKFLYQGLDRRLRNAESKDKLVISFFFNARGNELEKTTLGLYRSLLFNLLKDEPDLQEVLCYCQRAYHNILESGWQLQMLKEVFEEAISLLQARKKRLYCFVDALDECSEDDVHDMVSYFEDLVCNTDSQYFRVCFSSRHYPQISIRTKLTITLEEEAEHNEDIEVFIGSQLKFEQDNDSELLQQISNEILEKSSGIFLWVNLVVHQLKEVYRQDGRMSAVQQRLRNIPKAVMKRPTPNGSMALYGLFEDILQKDKKKIDDLVRITQIVFCAKRPLRPKELYVLLHKQYNDPFNSKEVPDEFITKHVLEVSKGLAEVTKSKEPTVQFIHETVREFLQDGGLESISTRSLDRDGHEEMKASCLEQIQAPVSEHLVLLSNYRRWGDYRNSQNSRVHKITRERQKEFQEQATSKFPFLEYAAKNILFHAEEAEYIGIFQSKFLEKFPLEEWIPLYNLFEKFNTRRYSGDTTPILYILAGHGCDHLINSSATLKGQYAREVKGNECSSALASAIVNGHIDTAWTLVGLDVKTRPRGSIEPLRRGDWSEMCSLIPLLLRVGDVQLTRAVLEDQDTLKNVEFTNIDIGMFNSVEMIDLFLELATVPGFPSVGYRHQNSQAEQEASGCSQSNTDLTFIRRAIMEKPRLLWSEDWDGMNLFDYAFRRRWLSLMSLYLECLKDTQPAADYLLRIAADEGDIEMVGLALQYNANTDSQDEEGATALILAASHGSDQHENTLRYLLSEDTSCVNLRNYSGRTALSFAVHRHDVFQSHDGNHLSSLFERFLEAGADINDTLSCITCNRHEVPLITFLALGRHVELFKVLASDDRCNLNARDSLGRTALSWCLGHLHGGVNLLDWNKNHWKRDVGEYLLQQQAVDVNSRDYSGRTILEHFIRYPILTLPFPVAAFFRSKQLNTNLLTSNGQHPLELILSLYNTWTGALDGVRTSTVMRQEDFNEHLTQALELLLGTGTVDIHVQRRCADQAPPELKGIIEQHGRHEDPPCTVLTIADLCN